MKDHKKITGASRTFLLIAAVFLGFVLYTPVWRIELSAPQYPEGLKLLIHANNLKGDVDIINGLNHYIGMKTLHKEDFIEFTVLPWCIIFFMAAFAMVAVAGKRKFLNILLTAFILFGIIAIIDFWRWEYNYGHNLNPNAAIVVPGMAYQPPLIGFKQLLNFGAYSIPDTGGWLFIGAGVILLGAVIMEWRRMKKNKKTPFNKTMIIAFLLPLSFNSCSPGSEPLKPGIDNCHFCKMTITDPRFGAELVTKKGKIYKFDDIACIVSFIHSRIVEKKDIGDIYLVDYTGSHTLSKKENSFLITSDHVRGPMSGNIISFSNADSMKNTLSTITGSPVNWEQILNR